MGDFADQLIAEFDRSSQWPLPRETNIRQVVAERRAFRRGEKPTLKSLANWGQFTRSGRERDYLVDSLPKLIAKAFAEFLFAEDPTFTATQEGEQNQLDEAVQENRIVAGLPRAERICVSEGEVWWKVHVNRDIAAAPLLEWQSRLAVVPRYYGDRLLACAFVNTVATTSTVDSEGKETEVYWRHVEVHTEGRVANLLYKGTCEQLGKRVALTTRPETAELAEQWSHGLSMLAGRVVNDTDESEQLGESDYEEVRDLFLALNEALTISVENARLTGKDRVFAAGTVLEQDGNFDASLEVLRVETEGGTLGEDTKAPVMAIEKRYDAEALWTHIAKLTVTALTRVGIVQQLIGEDVEGRAESGTAIRLRFLPTVNAASGKAREWDATLPQIVHRIMLVGALPEAQGGFNWSYSSDEPPTVERSEVLPADDTEIVNRNATAVTGGIRSRWEAIQEQHPQWGDDEIGRELARIRSDEAMGPSEPTPNVPAPELNGEVPEPVAV